MVVPTMLQRIVDELELQGRGLPALRTLSYGGGRMPLSVVQKAMRLLPHVDFVNAYGLTETSSTIAILSPDDHRTASSSSDEMVAKRLGSVGKPLPHLELQVRDHQGNVQPPGSPGEVFVRGEQISGEYVGHKTVRDDGWFPTKDMGWLDADGYLFIEGRLDDVIVRGGENISPGEIEDVLRSHADVADAAVFGSPDDQWGERIVAVVVRVNPLRVQLTIPEQFISAVRVGQPVNFEVDAYPGQQFTGTIKYVSPSLQADQRALTIEATVPNPTGMLKPGLFATARIERAERTSGVLVPKPAVQVVSGTSRVFVVNGDHVEERIVTTGDTVGELIEITTGLKSGERVATKNVGQLADGTKVQ